MYLYGYARDIAMLLIMNACCREVLQSVSELLEPHAWVHKA